jgi:hypothetical protein
MGFFILFLKPGLLGVDVFLVKNGRYAVGLTNVIYLIY